MNFFKSTPSKFGKGTGLLWRGMNQKLLNSFVSNFFYKSKSQLYKQKEKLLNIFYIKNNKSINKQIYKFLKKIQLI